jgi:hypothetical protein
VKCLIDDLLTNTMKPPRHAYTTCGIEASNYRFKNRTNEEQVKGAYWIEDHDVVCPSNPKWMPAGFVGDTNGVNRALGGTDDEDASSKKERKRAKGKKKQKQKTTRAAGLELFNFIFVPRL